MSRRWAWAPPGKTPEVVEDLHLTSKLPPCLTTAGFTTRWEEHGPSLLLLQDAEDTRRGSRTHMHPGLSRVARPGCWAQPGEHERLKNLAAVQVTEARSTAGFEPATSRPTILPLYRSELSLYASAVGHSPPVHPPGFEPGPRSWQDRTLPGYAMDAWVVSKSSTSHPFRFTVGSEGFEPSPQRLKGVYAAVTPRPRE